MNNEHVEHKDQLGNTKPKTGRQVGKRFRKWCFTLNNPTLNGVENPEHLSTKFLYLNAKKFIYQLEEGEEKTPHLQGVIEFVNARQLSGLKEINDKIHWEVCNNWEASIAYCSKEKGRLLGPWKHNITIKKRIPKRIKETFNPYGWQLDLAEKLNEPPSERQIFWYWSEQGNIGKTTFAKWCYETYPTLIVGGKSNDIKYALSKHIEEDKPLDIIIFDIPRCHEGHVSYDAIEKIKDGLFFSCKYESGCVEIPDVHLIVFANHEPEVEKLSEDRWIIRKIQ